MEDTHAAALVGFDKSGDLSAFGAKNAPIILDTRRVGPVHETTWTIYQVGEMDVTELIRFDRMVNICAGLTDPWHSTYPTDQGVASVGFEQLFLEPFLLA